MGVSIARTPFNWCLYHLFWILSLLMALYIAGALLETFTTCVDSVRTFMCDPGHPILTIVGMASICVPLANVPTDPFGTGYLGGLIVQVGSKMEGS